MSRSARFAPMPRRSGASDRAGGGSAGARGGVLLLELEEASAGEGDGGEGGEEEPPRAVEVVERHVLAHEELQEHQDGRQAAGAEERLAPGDGEVGERSGSEPRG